MSKIQFAIVGCGHIAKKHAQHVVAHSEAQLAGVYDCVLEKGKQFAETFTCQQADTLENLLKRPEIDIVTVCTPNGNHFETAMAALKAKKHVLIEKPMALRKEDCESLIHYSLSVDRKVFIVKQNRYNPPIQALKRLLNQGKLGKIYFVSVNCFWNRNEQYYLSSDWKGTKELDGGTLYTQFSHFVDIMYYLFGDIVDIQGKMKNVNHQGLIEFEDTGSFVFSFKNGALGNLNYTTSCFKQNMEGSVTVFAQNGTIKIGGKYLNSIEYQMTEGADILDLPPSNPPNQYGSYEGSMSNHDKVIDNVVNTLLGKESMMTNSLEGMKIVEIIERMYEAAAQAPVSASLDASLAQV